MTSKLKCPFCGKELVPTTMGDNDTVLYASVWLPIKNCICNTEASKKIWQALIQAKQGLEIAQQALKEIRQHGLNDTATRFAMGFIADKALEQIRKGNYNAKPNKGAKQ